MFAFSPWYSLFLETRSMSLVAKGQNEVEELKRKFNFIFSNISYAKFQLWICRFASGKGNIETQNKFPYFCGTLEQNSLRLLIVQLFKIFDAKENRNNLTVKGLARIASDDKLKSAIEKLWKNAAESVVEKHRFLRDKKLVHLDYYEKVLFSEFDYKEIETLLNNAEKLLHDLDFDLINQNSEQRYRGRIPRDGLCTYDEAIEDFKRVFTLLGE